MKPFYVYLYMIFVFQNFEMKFGIFVEFFSWPHLAVKELKRQSHCHFSQVWQRQSCNDERNLPKSALLVQRFCLAYETCFSFYFFLFRCRFVCAEVAKQFLICDCFAWKTKTGAPNEDIVQNHLTWHCWTYFSIQTVDIGIFLSPKNFPSVRIS